MRSKRIYIVLLMLFSAACDKRVTIKANNGSLLWLDENQNLLWSAKTGACRDISDAPDCRPVAIFHIHGGTAFSSSKVLTPGRELKNYGRADAQSGVTENEIEAAARLLPGNVPTTKFTKDVNFHAEHLGVKIRNTFSCTFGDPGQPCRGGVSIDARTATCDMCKLGNERETCRQGQNACGERYAFIIAGSFYPDCVPPPNCNPCCDPDFFSVTRGNVTVSVMRLGSQLLRSR